MRQRDCDLPLALADLDSAVGLSDDDRLEPLLVKRRKLVARETHRIDGEALVRALMAYHRGEPRVCAMLQVPRSEEVDRRQGSRGLKTLMAAPCSRI